MTSTTGIRVSIDVGCYQHSVAVGLADGQLLDEFDIDHEAAGFSEFFKRIDARQRQYGGAVKVAMEGYNGHARPLDTLVRQHHYQLFNINNPQTWGSGLTFQHSLLKLEKYGDHIWPH